MACRVVCISREAGAGGEQVGRLVADELGWTYVDDEIVARAAASAGVQAGRIEGEERGRSLARRALDAIAAGGAGSPPGVGPSTQLPSHDAGVELQPFVREAVAEAVSRTNVVIVAHAASFAVEQTGSALRVLLTASPETRAARLGEEQGLADGDAARAVKSSDAGRREYLKRFHGVDRELPTHYDLVLNTDTLDVERAAQIVAHAARLA